MEKHITLAEYASQAGITRQTAYKWAAEGGKLAPYIYTYGGKKCVDIAKMTGDSQGDKSDTESDKSDSLGDNIYSQATENAAQGDSLGDKSDTDGDNGDSWGDSFKATIAAQSAAITALQDINAQLAEQLQQQKQFYDTQLAVKDKQIEDLATALKAAQDSLHAEQVNLHAVQDKIPLPEQKRKGFLALLPWRRNTGDKN